MTLIGMDYLKHQETKRSNLATEEIRRAELEETHRHNTKYEGIQQGNLDELKRHNERDETIKDYLRLLDERKFDHQKIQDTNRIFTDLMSSTARNPHLQSDIVKQLSGLLDTNSVAPGGQVDLAPGGRSELYLDRLSDQVLADMVNKYSSAAANGSKAFESFTKGLAEIGVLHGLTRGGGNDGGPTYSKTQRYDENGKLIQEEYRETGKQPFDAESPATEFTLPPTPQEFSEQKQKEMLNVAGTATALSGLAALAAWAASKGKGGGSRSEGKSLNMAYLKG